MRNTSARGALLAVAILWTGCQRLPPLPEVDLRTFAPAVREQIEEARREVAANPNRGEANGRLGMLYHTYRLDPQAEVCYQRAQSLDGRNAQWSYLRGLIGLRQARFAEAASLFEQALVLEPKRPVIRLRLAEALAGALRRKEAEREYGELIAAGQALPYAHLGKGRLLESQGRLDEAIGHLQQACDLEPGFKEARYALAQAQRRKGDAAGAEKNLALHRAAGNLTPRLEDIYRAKLVSLDISSQGYINRSVGYDQAGQVDLAILELIAGLRRHPGNINAEVNLISLYARARNYEEAERYFRLVTAAKPASPEAHFYWANTLAAQERYAEAAEAVSKTLAGNPEFPGAATLAGDLLAATHREAEAEKQYRAALQLRPGDPVASVGLGQILVGRGRAAEALLFLEQGRSAPGRAAIRAYRLLDRVCGQLGEHRKQRMYLEEAFGVYAAGGTPEEFAWVQKRLAQPAAGENR